MLSVIHTNIRKTAMPRTGRTLDALVTGASGSGGGSVAAQGEQYWELVTVAADGSALAQEDYYLRPRQDLNVVSQRNLIAYGDVIAKSVEAEIEDAELPKAGIGLYNFGLTAFKANGGILIDSDGLAYVDPSYAGGGGLDIDQLEQYLTTNGYLKLHDPATSLLMTGYVKAGAYSPILATDNLSVAIGKIEKHFDDYVTLATAQTITGAKIFSLDIIGQGDIIAKSTSEAISDAELPIASRTQLGLIKVGSGFEIMADGTLNNTGGGLTEVYWGDIKNPPTTLVGYGITASDVLTTLKTVDGSGSGLDADTLDGFHATSFSRIYGKVSHGVYMCLGTINLPQQGYAVRLYLVTGYGYNAHDSQNRIGMIILRTSNSSSNEDGRYYAGHVEAYRNGIYNIYVVQNSNTSFTFWTDKTNYTGTGFISVESVPGVEFVNSRQTSSSLPDGAYQLPTYQIAYTDSNVASASKLSPGCKIWGQTLTGDSDVNGNMTGVGSIDANGEIRSTSANAFRAVYGNYGFFMRNDGSDIYFLLTNSGDRYGSYNNLRPFIIYCSTGNVYLGNGALYVQHGGNTGFGTSSPQAKIHVVGDGLFTGNLHFTKGSAQLIRDDYDYPFLSCNTNGTLVVGAANNAILSLGYGGQTKTVDFYVNTESFASKGIGQFSRSGLTIGIVANANAMLDVRGDGLFTGDVICKSTSSAISDSELPIASASTMGLIKVGSGLKITNGVLSVTASGGGGSNVYWGSATTNMVPLYVDGSFYELARNNHSHDVATSGSGNAVTGISFSGRKMTLTKGSTFSLSGHTHSQYLTSHQRIYTLTIQKNGSTIGSYTPNQANKTINITVEDATADPFNGGTITNALYINIPRGGNTKPFKVRYGSGNYFFLNHGGTPALMANNADSYNSNANITFNNSSVAATGFTYTGTSDMRLKDRIGDITGVLDKLAGIEAFFFRYKAEPNDIHIGVSAQEVIKVFPEVVPLIGDYYQLRYTDFLTAVSVNGIKELYALQKQTTNEIDVLKQRIALLEAENQNLWNIINEINEKEAA